MGRGFLTGAVGVRGHLVGAEEDLWAFLELEVEVMSIESGALIPASVQMGSPPSHARTRGNPGWFSILPPSKTGASGRWVEGAEYKRHTCMLMFLKQLSLN